MSRLVVPGLAVLLFGQTGLRAGLLQTPPNDLAAALPSGPCAPPDQRASGSGMDEEKFQQSLRVLQDRLLSDSRNPGLHYQLGLLYESQRHFLKAIGEYREAFRLDSSSEEPALALASILSHCGQNQEAAEVLQGFLQTRPDSVPGIRLLCRVHLHEGEFDRALTLAEKYVRLDPGDSYGHYLLGVSFNGLSHFEKARNGLERSVELNPSFADAYLRLGLLHSRDYSTFPLAVENLRKAIALGVTQPEAHKDLGFALLKLGRHQEAIEELELALKDNPDYIEPYHLLADAYRQLGMKEQVAVALERFRSLRSVAKDAENQVQKYYWEGMDRLAEDQPDQAYSSFLKVVEISPDMDSALYRLAQIDFFRGDVQRAEDRIRHTIRVYPLAPEYHFLLARCLQQSDLAAAVDAIKTAIDLSPAVADFHNLLANLWFAGADYQAAIRAYRRAIEIDSEDPVPHLNLSTALRNIGAVEESEREKTTYFRLLSARNPE